MHVLSTVEEVERLAVDDPERLAYVTQTTLSVDDTREVIEALERRFPAIRGPELKDICYATQNRQNAVKELAGGIDLLLVVGSQNSSNSNRLRELGLRSGVPAHLIDAARGDRPDLVPAGAAHRPDRRRLRARVPGPAGARAPPRARRRVGPRDGRRARGGHVQAARRAHAGPDRLGVSSAGKTLRGLLVSLVTLVILAVLAEGGLRLWLRVRGQAYESAATRATIAALGDEAAGELPGLRAAPDGGTDGGTGGAPAEENGGDPAARQYQLHPYTGFHLEGSEETVKQALEFLASPEGSEAFTIVLLGGSVATIFASEPLRADERLAAALEASGRLGERVEVLSFACPAHKQPQQLEMITYLLSLGASPDMVLSLDGYNEVFVGPANLVDGLPLSYPSFSYWVHLAGARKLDHEGMDLLVAIRARQNEARDAAESALDGFGLGSAVLGRLALARVERAHAGWSAAQAAYVAHRAASGETAEARRRPANDEEIPWSLGLEESVAVWYQSSLLVQALCRDRGIRYVHALQPALATGSKTPTAEERERGLARESRSQSVAEGFGMLRARGADLCAAGVEFHDLTEIYAGVAETIYIDACHVGDRGNQILADELAAALLAQQ